MAERRYASSAPVLDAPQNSEAEMCVLGAMLLSENTVVALKPSLTAEMFYVPAHAEVHRAIMALHESGSEVDLVTLRDKLRDRGTLQDVGGVDYLIQMIDRCPTTVNARDYARIVREKYFRRQLECQGRDAVGLAHHLVDEDERAVMVEQLAWSMMGVARGLRGHEEKGFLAEALERRGMRPIKTGITPWDEMAGGLILLNMTVLHGPTKAGKSFLAQQACLSAAREARKVIVFSSELTAGEYGDRGTNLMLGIGSADEAEAKGQFDEYRYALEWMMDAIEFRSCKARDLTLAEIQSTAKEILTEPGGVLCIDLVGDVKTGKRYYQNGEEQAEVARALTIIAAEQKCAVIAVVQEGEDNGKSTTRGSQAWMTRCGARIRLQVLAVNDEGDLVKPYRPPKDGEDSLTFFTVLNLRGKGRTGRFGLVRDEQRGCFSGLTGYGWSVTPPDPFEMPEVV